MSFLKKLKELLSADDYKKVEKELNGKELFINDGENYVPKKTFNEELEKVKTLKTEKEASEKKIADLEKKMEEQAKAIEEKDAELILTKKEGVLKEALTESGVKNPKNLKLLMKEFDLGKMEN